jgi:hypothetical protein
VTARLFRSLCAIVGLITLGWVITPLATALMDALGTVPPSVATTIYQLLVCVNLVGLALMMPALFAFRRVLGKIKKN